MDFSFYIPQLASAAGRTERYAARPVEWGGGVVVRASNWLGDSLMTLPAVAQLGEMLPAGLGLWVMCPAGLAPVWEAVPRVSGVIPLSGRRASREDTRRLRGLNAGVAVVFPNSFGSALDVSFCGISLRVGRSGRARSLLLSRTSPRWRPAERHSPFHQASHYLDVVSLLGPVRRTPDMPRLKVDGQEATLAKFGLTGAEAAGALLLAPGAAYGPSKQWPLAHFRRVAEDWVSRGGRVLVAGSAKEQSLGEQLVAGLPGGVSLCGKTTLGELMAVLSTVRACVVNDSGVMHLAAALGACGVAVFGSTNPGATGPLGGRWVILREELDCSPCFARTCVRPERDYRCLTRIGAERVVAALAGVL